MAKKTPFPRRWRWLKYPAYALCLWLVLTWSLVFALRFIPPARSAFMLEYNLARMTHSNRPPLKYRWVAWKDINYHVALAVMAAEDQKFPQHHGFDFASIQLVLSQRKERPRGASTISQQTAKNLFLWPSRSWLRKGVEAYFTVLMEITWPKQRIAEIYINIAEFGEGIYGIGAASKHFFHTDPAHITRHQAALLAAVLPNPKKRHAAKPSAYVAQRAAWIERQMRQLGGRHFIEQIEK